jgi:hypothetical protein
MLEVVKIPALLALFVLSATACSSSAGANGDSCNPGDQDGVTGATSGTDVVLVSVNDTEFTVGGVDSGSTAPNIAVQNLTTVMLTLTNTGTKPHGMQIACIPTGLPAGCPSMSCFPANANIPALAPGASVTTTYVTPAVEGAYQFTDPASDVDGGVPADGGVTADGGITGPVGELVLM